MSFFFFVKSLVLFSIHVFEHFNLISILVFFFVLFLISWFCFWIIPLHELCQFNCTRTAATPTFHVLSQRVCCSTFCCRRFTSSRWLVFWWWNADLSFSDPKFAFWRGHYCYAQEGKKSQMRCAPRKIMKKKAKWSSTIVDV